MYVILYPAVCTCNLRRGDGIQCQSTRLHCYHFTTGNSLKRLRKTSAVPQDETCADVGELERLRSTATLRQDETCIDVDDLADDVSPDEPAVGHAEKRRRVLLDGRLMAM